MLINSKQFLTRNSLNPTKAWLIRKSAHQILVLQKNICGRNISPCKRTSVNKTDHEDPKLKYQGIDFKQATVVNTSICANHNQIMIKDLNYGL